MNGESTNRHNGLSSSITDMVRHSALDPGLLYETVIELAGEGLLTAGCLNHAARILLTELGLPAYFFEHISPQALKTLLRFVATHIEQKDGGFVLRDEVAEVGLDVDSGVQVRIATDRTRDHMETVLNPVLSENRVAYYFSRHSHYYTYTVHQENCKELAELKAGESPFAFAQTPDDPTTPQATKKRYESFLKECRNSVIPLIKISRATASHETRVMFKDDFTASALPVIRKLLENLGVTLDRAYWETYRGPTGRVESICSVYLEGRPPRSVLNKAVNQLRALMALHGREYDQLLIQKKLAFDEYLFTANAAALVHNFIYKGLRADSDIMNSFEQQELRAAFAGRIFNSHRSEYTRKVIHETLRLHPDLLKELFHTFDRKFNPRFKSRPSARWLNHKIKTFQQQIAITFMDDTTGFDIFTFMTRIITDVYKTNFYKPRKRSFAFRLDAGALSPIVFPARIHGIFFVAGFYAIGTHMRADDVARGGLRLIRVTPENYETELDYMSLLNYALGPVAQRLKHKDIAESGAKGVIVPMPEFARDGLNAVHDFTEGIMDLIQPSADVLDYLGMPEMLFFGPDEGTAGFMDAVALRAKERGYKHWRTLTTGKSIGIPHDTFGLTTDRKVFGLIPRGDNGTELQLDGSAKLVTTNTARIHTHIGKRIASSGMTTMSVMTSFRAVLDHLKSKEENINLMMTGGPDGDLGANQIQSFKGRICLIIDGGGILFDPQGLDRKELMKIAFARHTEPRLNSMAYPENKLHKHGFKIPRTAGRAKLPDDTTIEDTAFFHRHFLTNSQNRKAIAQANIQAFLPCGGFKDTIHAGNVRDFIKLFSELRIIVEGANVFFDDTARETIAAETAILQIKDSSANKGGVTSSSVAEVLTAFLLGETYEMHLVRNAKKRACLIREVFDLVAENAAAETEMLLALHQKHGTPLYRLSVQTSEQLFALQDRLYKKLDQILENRPLAAAVLKAYIPPSLVKHLGIKKIMRVLRAQELIPYRNAILTKKLAAMALYRHAADWQNFLNALDNNFDDTLEKLAGI